MNILALDIGTKTGWALWRGINFTSGTKLLATDKELRDQKAAKLDRCCDLRTRRFKEFIETFFPLDWIYFEDVQFASSTYQVQLWASLRGVITVLYPGIKLAAVPVGTLKKAGSGRGDAKKNLMLQALAEKWPSVYQMTSTPRGRAFLRNIPENREVDDNEADAIHLLNYAIQKLPPNQP